MNILIRASGYSCNIGNIAILTFVRGAVAAAAALVAALAVVDIVG